MDEKSVPTRRGALLMAAGAVAPEGAAKGHPVVYFEIGCKDLEKTGAFYSALFDWKLKPAGIATDIETGGSGGVPGHLVALGHEPHHYTMFYVEVESATAALAKAVELGGKKVVGPIPIPTGLFAWFTDPEGNQIGLLQPKR